MENKKIPWVFEKIHAWFEKNQRTGLPWRKNQRGAYEVWVSEIMLQQTQVSRVIPFYERFLKRFPAVQSLAKASWEEFLPYYQGLGYYSRGRNMLKTAQAIVERHGGEFPQEKSLLVGLPGIGEYTANAILSFAYDQPVLTFDTNHQKVWGRILHGNKKTPIDAEKILSHFPKNASSVEINEAFMDFANTVCLNTRPLCEVCPLREKCEYFTTNGKNELIVARTKSAFSNKEAQAYVILHQNNRIFYSEDKQFTPFILPVGINSRAQIKHYFLEKYGLTLSVRPPFRREIVEGAPTLFIKAQVLLGKHSFLSYSLTQYKTWFQDFAQTI